MRYVAYAVVLAAVAVLVFPGSRGAGAVESVTGSIRGSLTNGGGPA